MESKEIMAYETYELGKVQVDYDRHLTLFGKERADTVLYFWMEGYKHASLLLKEKDIKIMKLERDLKASESVGNQLADHIKEKDEEIEKLKAMLVSTESVESNKCSCNSSASNLINGRHICCTCNRHLY